MNGIKNMLLGIAIILLYLLAHVTLKIDIIVIIGIIFILYGYFYDWISKSDSD